MPAVDFYLLLRNFLVNDQGIESVNDEDIQRADSSIIHIVFDFRNE